MENVIPDLILKYIQALGVLGVLAVLAGLAVFGILGNSYSLLLIRDYGCEHVGRVNVARTVRNKNKQVARP